MFKSKNLFYLLLILTSQMIILNCLKNNDDKGGGGLLSADLDQLGYNYDELTDSSETQPPPPQTTTQQTTLPTSNDYSCQLQVQSETYSTKQDISYMAYAGNAFNYEVSCHVNDAKMRPGDKYYIIDLILYGPNNRVQRAWREQFNSNILAKSKNLAINKKVSYRWLGINSFVCSVTKYNYLINKFTRTCQKTSKVNVTEKTPKYDEYNPFMNLLTSTSFYGDNFIFKSNQRIITTTTQAQKSTTTISLTLKNKSVNSKNVIKFDYYDDDIEKTNQIKQTNKDTPTTFSSNPVTSLNLSAKAMQFRDVYETNHHEDKKLVNDSKKLFLNSKTNKTSLNVEQLLNRRIKFLQPLFVITLFLIIFFISIGTIIYLTYYQKTKDEHRRRSGNSTPNTDTLNDKMLKDKNIQPIVSSSHQDQSGESIELSRSLTNENVSECTEENSKSKNIFKKFKSQFIQSKMTRTIIIKGGRGNKKSQKCEYSSACSSSASSSDNHSQSNECSISNSSDCVEQNNKNSNKKSVINIKVECEDCDEANEWDKLNK